MNKRNLILDFEDILNTYKSKMPRNKLKLLRERDWLPLRRDSLLARNSAYLIGKVMGDGNLDNLFTCRFIGQLKDLEELRNFIINNYSLEKSRFKINFRSNIGKSYLLQVNDSLLGRMLYALGAPAGNKVMTTFLIPRWIISSKYAKKYFLQGILEDELATIKIKRRRYIREPTFRMAKAEKNLLNLYQFLFQIKTLIENFSIKCSKITEPYFENTLINGNKTFSQCFRIFGNKKNISNFSKYVGFKLNQKKIRELEKCVDLIKKMRRPGFEPG